MATLRLCNITAKLPSERLCSWPPENRSVVPKGDRGPRLRNPGLVVFSLSYHAALIS